MSSHLESLRAARFAYPFGLLLILAPLLELAGRIWPVQWYLVQWRFQTEIAVLNATPIILIGSFVVAVIAWADESVSILKVLGSLLVVFGVLLLPLVAMLALDGIQIRQMARSELRGPIRNNTIIAVLRGALAAAAALGLGVGAMRIARNISAPTGGRTRTRTEREEEMDSPLLVVGSDE
jgi:hypothetical protein